MTTQTAPRTTRSARSSVDLDPALRAVRCETARWALATGRPLNLDAITVILAARHREAVLEGRPFNRWTTNTVLTFLFGTAETWCADQGVALPRHLGESLLTFIDFLVDGGVLSSGSSPPRQLRSTIIDLSGLSPAGLRRPHRNDADGVIPTPLRARTTEDGGVAG